VKLTKSRKKESIENEREVEGRKYKIKNNKREYQGKQQGEMVDDQRANQTTKPLKEGNKQTNKQTKITSSGTVEFQS
jgi:hypothetical protein